MRNSTDEYLFGRHVDAYPTWAKNLQAHLTPGIHTIKFRARSPSDASITDVCQTVINVKSTAPPPANNYPEVVYCPPSIEIQLEPNEMHRSVFWKDPKFNSDKHLKQILATQLPGTKFAVGRHNIIYTATDLLGRNATCRFTVTLTASARKYTWSGVASAFPTQLHTLHNGFCSIFLFIVAPHNNHAAYTAVNYHTPLNNHVSTLLCPGKPAMKLDTSFPVSSVRVFYRQLDKTHRFGKAPYQNQFHTSRRINNEPKHFIDIYHWSVFD